MFADMRRCDSCVWATDHRDVACSGKMRWCWGVGHGVGGQTLNETWKCWHIWGMLFIWTQWIVVDVDRMLKCKAPELGCDYIGPHLHGMQKHGMGSGCDFPDVPLDDSILPVSADSTEQLLLITCIKMVTENLGWKTPLSLCMCFTQMLYCFVNISKSSLDSRADWIVAVFWQCTCKNHE